MKKQRLYFGFYEQSHLLKLIIFSIITNTGVSGGIPVLAFEGSAGQRQNFPDESAFVAGSNPSL